jgi:hypothetical protein
LERGHEPSDGLAKGPCDAAFEILDGPLGQSCPLGEGGLRQTGGQPMLTEQRPETGPIGRIRHRRPPRSASLDLERRPICSSVAPLPL